MPVLVPLPERICTQPFVFSVVHAHGPATATLTVPVEALGPCVALTGSSVVGQGAPDCDTVKAAPAMVMTPRRAVNCAFDATV